MQEQFREQLLSALAALARRNALRRSWGAKIAESGGQLPVMASPLGLSLVHSFSFG